MTKEKTIREWFEILPDGYRERALKNYEKYRINSLSRAISETFLFRVTPEGYDFWCDVIDWSVGEGNLPPLPKEEK